MKMETLVVQAVMQTERFDLRPLRASDAGLIELHASDARVARATRSIPHPLPPGTTEAFIARAVAQNRSEDIWAIDATRSDGAEIMGVLGLERLERDQAEVNFWVAPAFRNAGVASEALEAVLRENPQGNRTFFASVFQDNPASARVLTKAGFSYLGDAETFSVARNAKVPTWTYSFTVTD